MTPQRSFACYANFLLCLGLQGFLHNFEYMYVKKLSVENYFLFP